MEVLSSNITIGSYTFDFVNDVRIESSWKNLTDTATITLPSKLKFDRGQLKSALKKGDLVNINLGYGDEMNLVFSGFVTQIHTGVPVVIEAEDLMWKLKQITVNTIAKNETLKAFISRIAPGYSVDCFDISLPKFTASQITVAKLLDELKRDMGFQAFIRDGVIVVGKQYDPSNYTTHEVILNYNVAEESLEFLSKDDIKLKVTAISNYDNGTKEEIEIGSPEGETRTLNFYNIPKADLKAIATKEYERLLYDGFRGSVTIFGSPFIKHGDVVHLSDPLDSDKQGSYWVDTVNYEFGVNGFRQQIELGSRNT